MECIRAGARQEAACQVVGITPRTLQRWRLLLELEDQRRGPTTIPAHTLTKEETDQMVTLCTSAEFCDQSPRQIVPILADRGEWIASESSFYRVLKVQKMLTHRGRSEPKSVHRPKALEATRPNQIFSWDITYLPTSVKGRYFYLYLFLDIFSRKIVGWKIHERESMELSAALLVEICKREGIVEGQLTVHADNGGAMKGATMLATMQALGVVSSFSRPSVSDDNPFSESLFKTLKYAPQYPSKPFGTLEEASDWTQAFVHWYNSKHLHSGIQFVTPGARHEGADIIILEKRHQFYQSEKLKHPQRWSKETRNWTRQASVQLNFLKGEKKSDRSAPDPRIS